jgi:hypothetical protein
MPNRPNRPIFIAVLVVTAACSKNSVDPDAPIAADDTPVQHSDI